MSQSGGRPGPYSANASGATTPGSTGTIAALLYVNNASGAWNPVLRGSSIVDGDSGADSIPVNNGVWNGATYDRLRTPIVFKQVAVGAAAVETTIWTPAAGKKFRLMGFALTIDTATTNVSIRDNTAGTVIFTMRNAFNTAEIVNLGNGILSAAANNVLTAQAGAANGLWGTVWGTEE